MDRRDSEIYPRDSKDYRHDVKSILMLHMQDQKLRTALQDYENEKWRIVANKVGTGFTPVACRERAAELMEDNL